MCRKESPPGARDPKLARKTRTKTRRPKFLSLRLKLSPGTSAGKADRGCLRENQLDPLPFLHPENGDAHHDDGGVASFFHHADGGATSLTGLLSGSSDGAPEQMRGVPSLSADRDDSPSPASLTRAYGGAGRDAAAASYLVQTAMRRGRRRREEERWVSYEEVVERKEEEVTSCCCFPPEGRRYHHHPRPQQQQQLQLQRLSLKLDYEEIMNAWSDKGPLYIEAEAPQTVPDFADGGMAWMDGWGSRSSRGGEEGSCRVPEKDEGGVHSAATVKMGTEEEGEDEANRDGQLKPEKMGQREASVLRYKEKRRNRLFSKRIRYEVRKLNAEKRPRIKGRFVKRS